MASSSSCFSDPDPVSASSSSEGVPADRALPPFSQSIPMTVSGPASLNTAPGYRAVSFVYVIPPRFFVIIW